ncbi:hypothetical protein G4B88_021384 [Cannabis sativa]|uniref:Glutathione S-transferase n=1 Tax=Cannabis sativa TaxID=3483 RepID=A0A7J6FI67_CANSA|nr:hypothetical protein G4B88_021384 [Cannabis sativa]
MGDITDEVKLFRTWSTPFALRIVWALQLKGVQYQTIYEDLSNKSDALLLYNPIHKKVPVLLHNSKPISESLVLPAVWDAFTKAAGKEQEEAYSRSIEKLKLLDEELKGKKLFGGEEIGMVDIALGWLSNLVSVFEEITGLKFIDEHTMPRLSAWKAALNEIPVVKENWPDYAKLLTKFTVLRETYLSKEPQK